MLTYLHALLATRTSDRGSSAVEYVLIMAGVGIVLGVTWGFFEVLGVIFNAALADVSVKVP